MCNYTRECRNLEKQYKAKKFIKHLKIKHIENY